MSNHTVWRMDIEHPAFRGGAARHYLKKKNENKDEFSLFLVNKKIYCNFESDATVLDLGWCAKENIIIKNKGNKIDSWVY